MRKTLQLTTWAVVAGMTAHADSFGPEISESLDSAPLLADEAAPASPEQAEDTFAVALAVLNGEASGDTAPDVTAPVSSEDCFLTDGQVSTFQIGAAGSDKVTVNGGLSVGATAVDTHVIDIVANGRVKSGTYTLIDYDGSIGGAGFAGLSLRCDPHLHAELVNNTAESKIEVVVTGIEAMELASAVKSIWSSVTQSDWILLPRLLQRPAQQVQ